MPRRERLFAIRQADIQQLLFVDNSDDDDDDLLLDEEDQNFLLQDVDNVSQEVIIEHPDPCSTAKTDTSTDVSVVYAAKPLETHSFYSQQKRSYNTDCSAVTTGEQEQSTEVQPNTSNSKSTTRTGRRRKNDSHTCYPDDSGKQVTPTVPEEQPPATKRPATSRGRPTITDVDFKWKRATAKPTMDTVEYKYGQVNLSYDDPEDVDPVTVFEQVTDFGNLLSLIRGQSELYMKQKGIPFATNEDELRAFLGICLVMGYHVLPSIRDYWSTQPDLHVRL